MKSNTNNLSKLIAYLVTLGFLFPIGFSQYFNIYKRIQTIYIIFTTLVIVLFLFYRLISSKKIKINFALVSLIICYVTLLIITLCKQHSINQGYQKLFFIPLMCIFINNIIQDNFQPYINILGNLLIGILSLNLLVFNQWFFAVYFNPSVNNAMFIGHVQTASEIGVLAILIGVLLKDFGKKRKGNFLLLLSLLTMIYSRTMASFLVLVELLIFAFLGRSEFFRKLVSKNIVFIFCILLVLNYFLINAYYYFPFNGELDSLTSGRVTIWYLGLLLVRENLISGYGAYGVKIRPYWIQWMNNNTGFNYAHNTILQLFLDGGIIVTILFVITLVLYIDNIKYIRHLKLKYFISCLVIMYLSIGMVESLTEYNYFFIFLSLLPFVNSFTKNSIS